MTGTLSIYALTGRRWAYVGTTSNPEKRFVLHLAGQSGVKRVRRYVRLCRALGAPLPNARVLFRYSYDEWPGAERHALECYEARGWHILNLNRSCVWPNPEACGCQSLPPERRREAYAKRLETLGPEGRRAASRKAIETMGPEGRSAASRKGRQTMGPEGRRAVTAKAKQTLGPEGRREAAHKGKQAMGPERRSAAAAKAKQTLGHERMSEIARKRQMALGPERRREAARKRLETLGPDGLSKITAKAAATRARRLSMPYISDGERPDPESGILP